MHVCRCLVIGIIIARVDQKEMDSSVKLKDMEKVTTPYTPDDFRVVFLDALSYLESLDEEDPEIAIELKNRSNFDQLVKVLNAFVDDKGISSKLTTVLYKLERKLQEAITVFASSIKDNEKDAVEEHLLRQRNIVAQNSWKIETAVRSIYQNTASEIREMGRVLANEIDAYKDFEDAKKQIEDAEKTVNTVCSKCEKDIIEKIEELSRNCQVQLDDFYKSDFSKKVQFQLEKQDYKEYPFVNKVLKAGSIEIRCKIK